METRSAGTVVSVSFLPPITSIMFPTVSMESLKDFSILFKFNLLVDLVVSVVVVAVIVVVVVVVVVVVAAVVIPIVEVFATYLGELAWAASHEAGVHFWAVSLSKTKLRINLVTWRKHWSYSSKDSRNPKVDPGCTQHPLPLQDPRQGLCPEQCTHWHLSVGIH